MFGDIFPDLFLCPIAHIFPDVYTPSLQFKKHSSPAFWETLAIKDFLVFQRTVRSILLTAIL